MKIVLVNHQEPDNINAFSGIPYFMTRAIKRVFEEVVDYNDFESHHTGNRVFEGHYRSSLRPIGNRLTNFLKNNAIEADFLLCQGGNTSIPFYNHHLPIVFWHDATWSSYFKAYQTTRLFNQFKADYRNLYLWDKQVLERADLLIYASDYIAEACIKHYKIPERKIKVVPFGANLFPSPPDDLLHNALKTRAQSKVINLTFIGKDWKRKGLTLAYHLVKKLNAMGIGTKLNIVGGTPDIGYIKQSEAVNMIGFIDKSDPLQHEKLEEILKTTHFMVHPASWEPFGIVLCEANAYGIPVFALDLEGPKTIIRPGKNGFLFQQHNFVNAACQKIKEIAGNFDNNYVPLFKSTVEEYQHRLNWDTSAQQVKNILMNFHR
jgi:glycosyltransferase involved in cell wall biosynthesis